MFGWLKNKKLQLSPAVHGQILLYGIPVRGITVIRDLNYGDKLFTDESITNAEGHFSFPSKTIKVRDSIFDTDVRHSIYVEQDTEIIKVFSISSLNTLDFKSFNTVLSNMICELTMPEQGYDLEPDQEHPGVYLGAIGKCLFTDKSFVVNQEVLE